MNRLIKDIAAAYGVEKSKLCKDVTDVVRAKVIAKDLFGWRSFIDDMLVDLISYMIKDEFKHSGGAYVNCGMQSAIDHCRYCNAAKRKKDYETVSLEEFYQVEDIEAPDSDQQRISRFLTDVALVFGQEVSDIIEPYARGYESKLSSQVSKILNSKEFKDWAKTYTLD